jgi:hypothetical protein
MIGYLPIYYGRTNVNLSVAVKTLTDALQHLNVLNYSDSLEQIYLKVQVRGDIPAPDSLRDGIHLERYSKRERNVGASIGVDGTSLAPLSESSLASWLAEATMQTIRLLRRRYQSKGQVLLDGEGLEAAVAVALGPYLGSARK